MTQDQTLLDRSEKLTDTGVGLLRISSGLFFLIPGIFKLLMPDNFLSLMVDFPDLLQPHLPWLFNAVIATEILGGIMLIIGWNIRLAVPALVIITVVAESLVVVNDTNSSIRLLSLYAHFMGAGLYTAMFFLGSGRWAVGRGKSLLHWIARQNFGALSSVAHDVVSGAGKNVGVFLIRTSVALPFLASFLLGNGDQAYNMVLPDNEWVSAFLLALSLIGGLSLLTGFQINSISWMLVALTLLHLIAVGIPDIPASKIGFINILFHLLIISAVVSLRLIRFGSDLEVEHILSLDKKNVVVIGGGFAGTQLVRKLERILSDDWQVVLLSEENYTTFNPMLAEVVGASVLPSHVIAPIRRMVRKTRFISARATSVDIDAKTVHFEGEDRSGSIGYEHLVFSFGSRANLDLVPGMQQHAMPFKLLGDALKLRNRVIEQMEKAELEEDPQKRQWMGHFIIIGAGFSGVEVGGAIQDFILASHKHYPRLHDEDLKVTIIHRRDLPLQEMDPKLGKHVLKKMSMRGVNLVLNTGVSEVDERGVVTNTQGRLDGATTICTIGTKPNPLIEQMNVPNQRGRLLVNADMSLQGHSTIWAIGDCALVPNEHDGQASPPTAQFAIREGQQLAKNIARVVRGEKSRPFNYKSKGSMATIGHLNGVAEMFGFIHVGGFPAWLMWRAFYLSLMPTMAKKTRIFFEWTWSMLFSPDIINLRFTTTDQADMSRKERSMKDAA
jgi:NADH dehydrogenase